MRRLLPLLAPALAMLAVLAVSGCGGSSGKSAPPPATTTAAPPSPASLLGPGGKALYAGGDWAVVVRGKQVVAAHWNGHAWKPDRSGAVKIDVLGPRPGTKAAALPQVAAELKAPAKLIEEGLWVDGSELLEKGGGLKPNDITVYGSPDTSLRPGTHVAVAYGRTDTTGSAVLWTFRV